MRSVELEAPDRLSSLTCLLLVLTALLAAPLVGVSERRLSLVLRPDALSSDPPHGPHTIPAPADQLAPALVERSRSPPRLRAGGTEGFVCVDFVCVNRTRAVPNLFDYTPAAIAALPRFHSFRSCVEQCVASAAGGGAAAPARTVATPVSATAPARTAAAVPTASSQPPVVLSGTGLVQVGNRSLDAALERWLAARHDAAACSASTPVYFAPFSPNGIGNKLMAIVMAFHMALMQGRRLVVSDWPPRTLDVSYPLGELLLPSACQPLFDGDRRRPAVRKCTVISCPLHTSSVFTHAYTQPHWAHMSALFLDLPSDWAHLDWLTWWRAITQYLLRPGPKLLAGLAGTLDRVRLLQSPSASPSTTGAEKLRRAGAQERAAAATRVTGFARRFAQGVASWGPSIRRPLIGVHVRLGDGCWDSKRGGCKYVRSFETILTRLREAGLKQGTIFLATDNSTIAAEAVARRIDGFDVLALGEDRRRVEKSHAAGDRRREGDEMLHLQLLDLALLSQADVIAGVFGSTFVKTALQLGSAAAYASLDTFPWCPLLRCYWGWRDMCHNCELCYNSGGGGEACNYMGYHTAGGLRHAMRDGRTARGAFRRFIGSVERDFRCRSFAEHPLAPTLYDRPVVGAFYAKPLPHAALSADTVCANRGGGGDACACGFRRFRGVDNALAAQLKPAYGYGTALVPRSQLTRGARPTIDDCERACCDEVLCHSVTWRANTSECVAALAIHHGARSNDWCWHPTPSENAVTSIRLHGSWHERAVRAAESFLDSSMLVRKGTERGPRTFRKAFRSPVGHSHPMERHMQAAACGATHGGLEVSDIGVGAVPLSNDLAECPASPSVNRARWKVRGP